VPLRRESGSNEQKITAPIPLTELKTDRDCSGSDSTALPRFCGTFTVVPGFHLSQVDCVVIDRQVVEATLDELQRFGERQLEGLVLWLGDGDLHRVHVRRAFVPEQEAISGEDGVGYFVSGETLFKLNVALAESGLRLIAQVHSHPGEAYHSEADDRYAIVTADGGFSLVVPDFGRAPADPAAWAVYRLSNDHWQELTPEQARSLLQVGSNIEH
jgi:proteasome lid subunit RPN8/RPN11